MRDASLYAFNENSKFAIWLSKAPWTDVNPTEVVLEATLRPVRWKSLEDSKISTCLHKENLHKNVKALKWKSLEGIHKNLDLHKYPGLRELVEESAC